MALYRDRHDAGEKLADALEDLRGTPNLLVLALPRGGVPVAETVARRLGAPLDVFVVRKIGIRATRSSPWAPSLPAASSWSIRRSQVKCPKRPSAGRWNEPCAS
jgi:hypothetical protein